jgi:adenylylsulfate kinase-like enzyme
MESQEEQDLAKLPRARGAAFDSYLRQHEPRCLPDTRVELLRQVMTWSDNPCGECIFWLNGMTGTGKSTIARTVCRDLARQNRLGASFFFTRGESNRSNAARFFTSVAVQLASMSPTIKRHICNMIRKDNGIAQKALSDQ